MSIRLDKLLSDTTPFSRAELKRLSRKKQIVFDGRAVTDLSQKITLDSVSEKLTPELTVTITGVRYSLNPRQNTYLALYKPVGVLSTTQDSYRPTVIDSVAKHLAKMNANAKQTQQAQGFIPLEQLGVCGRLDVDTSGLVLLTDDGVWNHKITSPKKKVEKEYRVEFSEPVDRQSLERLLTGIELKDGLAKAAAINTINKCTVDLTLTEGRHHQIKRMAHGIGNSVKTLHRFRIGKLSIAQDWQIGEVRSILPSDVLQTL